MADYMLAIVHSGTDYLLAFINFRDKPSVGTFRYAYTVSLSVGKGVGAGYEIQLT